jgi:multicomponent Na+:H+ antiporter subunit A
MTPDLEIPWLPHWGWSLHLRLDDLGALYALLAVGVALPVLAYAAAYMPGHLVDAGEPRRRLGAFYGWMALFLASMVGLALAADLVLLFVFFDLTALCSWALIGFDRKRAEARRAALTALLVTAGSSVGFLLGVLLLGHRHGTLRVAELAERAGASGGDPMTVAAAALILVAALAKSAQVPLHFWLPRAMAAPTPVSAYLHSAAMVAAGVFVLHRLHPLWPAEAGAAMQAAGWLSIFVGGLLALTARGLKRILAYSTIAHYGHATVLLGLGEPAAAAAAAVYVAVHALAKSALFLTAGAVTRATGAHELNEVGGLGRRMPLLAAASGLAAAGLAGLPATAGFFKDEAFFHQLHAAGGWATAGACVAVGLTVAYLWRFWSGIFLGTRFRAGRAEALSPRLTLPIAALALPLLAGGFAGGALAEAGRGAAAAVHGAEPAFELAYHLDPRATNRMALAGWLLGLGLVLTRPAWAAALERAVALGSRIGPARAWDLGLAGLRAASDRLHRFELRDLRDRLASIMLPTGAIVLLALAAGPAIGGWDSGAGLQREPALAIALTAAVGAAVAAAFARSHLGVVLFLSGVGYSLAAVFALLGGPDLALVAVLVETALTLLFVVALVRLPRERLGREAGQRRPRQRSRWHTVAALAATGIALVVTWAGLSNPADATIATEHVRLADEAHAGNVVAAILADFRGLDTLGETSVLVAALLGLLGLRGGGRMSSGGGDRGGGGG